MINVKEIFPYVSVIMAFVSSILAVVLTISARNLIGKGWLIAFTVITLVTWPGFRIISLIAQGASDPRQIFYWSVVLNLFALFGTACFGLFLFSNWSISRMKLNFKNLLFSLSGRIPRSAFWISLCILFPLGTILGFVTFTSEAEGFPKIIIWSIYVGWSILSIWISLAVFTKRWHDCSKSGWMSLILLIPVIGLFWVLGYLGFVQGSHDHNQYGDNPFNINTI